MILIDTNVLLRYLLQDDKYQSPKATSIIKGRPVILVTDVVLIETVWVLTGKRYELDREAVAGVIGALLAEPSILFEDPQTMWRALHDFKNSQRVKIGGKARSADFADALIVNKARRQARVWNTDFEGVYTFDVAARELSGMLAP